MKELRNLLLVITALTFTTSNFALAQDVENKETNFLTNTRQLIYEGNRSGEGYFSEDGRYLVFQSEREEENPFYQIYILDFETGDINRVSPGHGKTTCAYFQWTGDKVLFASSHHDPKAKQKQQDELDFRASGKERRYSWDYEPEMDIFIADRDGSDLTQLTSAYGYDAEGSYSPDGKLIVFASNREAYNEKLTEAEKKKLEVDPSYFCDLYIMNADGSGLRQLTDVKGYDGGPFFSPDGERVIWRRFGEDGHKADVYTINIDGTDEKRITNFNSMSWAPFYHPSGEYIIFSSNKYGYGNFELFLVDTEGAREPLRITYTDGFDGLPVFSPDGKKLVWTASRTESGNAQLFMANWDHEYALNVLNDQPVEKSQNKSSTKTSSTFTPEIKAEELKAKVEYLASDELEGRMTGSEGIRKAADYITGVFKEFGVSTLGTLEDYYHRFEFVSDYKVIRNKTSLKISNGKSIEPELMEDFIPLSSSDNGTFSGEIIFAGYGIQLPDNKYNSYSNLKAEGKIVMVLNGFPETEDEAMLEEFKRYSAVGYKLMIARQKKAEAIIFVSQNIDKGVSREMKGSAGIGAIEITADVAAKILGMDTKTFDEQFENSGDNEESNRSFAIPKGTMAEIEITVEKTVSEARNVVGVIHSDVDARTPYIVLGAHYDHLGYGEVNSRAAGDDKEDIHNGADDNASGVALVMELAEYFADYKKEHPEKFTSNIVFALWSGEELGLLGSSAFAKEPPIGTDEMMANLNFDMVGRLKNNKLKIHGIGSAEEWKKIIEKKNIVSGFDLTMTEDPFLPTDATSFYLHGVPVISFFTGVHDDYHTPDDDPDLLNYDEMERITNFVANITKELMATEELTYKTVERKNQRYSNKGNKRVSLGTIPGYGDDVEGIKLTGVRPNGPAARAGLQADDVIIEVKGKKMVNIYDYVDVLAELEAGKEYKMLVIRDGEEMEVTIVPESKE